MHIDEQHAHSYQQLFALQDVLRNPNESEKNKFTAHFTIQNVTREWIETVLSPAKQNGYDAVMCAEVDRYRPSGPASCINLHVFNHHVLSKPEWLNLPDESLMQSYLKKIEQISLNKA